MRIHSKTGRAESVIRIEMTDGHYTGMMEKWGLPVILKDGDFVFQPRKVEKSGLSEAVDGRVLIYLHMRLVP